MIVATEQASNRAASVFVHKIGDSCWAFIRQSSISDQFIPGLSRGYAGKSARVGRNKWDFCAPIGAESRSRLDGLPMADVNQGPAAEEVPGRQARFVQTAARPLA
jgi:hypothetical protein